ncbi:restriction endonuclease [Lysobacter sp. GX 14042]|uniref:restriction endonuclease n=1 Tax=Lysobacter sp. GX 14042 TaxID=2907155 RepID=UPI001F2250E9|nr:restriction endonuclease [Lysobacter sp. GX 14042]MCE7031419.1 restriction endonuclease [Lysobacter sp. GX 14042]
MPTLSFIAITLLVTVVAGGATSFWVRRNRYRNLVRCAGLRALSAMRWREYSRFVVEGLQQRGFHPSRQQPDADRGQDADLLLIRGGHTWLLGCRQGLDSQMGTEAVERLARSVRLSEARGGVLATLGGFTPAARKLDMGVELIDGPALWSLVEPVLPDSLLEDVRAQAKGQIHREGLLGWLIAFLLGMALAWLLTPYLAADSAAPAAPIIGNGPDATTPEVQAPPEAAPPPLPDDLLRPVALSEEEQRGRVLDEISALPDVRHAGWATRSTLVVRLEHQADDALIDTICGILLPYPLVRDQRVQLQPPEGGGRVRFTQCALY